MADSPVKALKSAHAEREERILSFWKEKDIFNKSLKKNEGKKEFVFFEGPPTANGRPGIHHLEARAFKDAIPRYKTMQGFHVRRKGGWDTHGLPVELQVEKELGLKSKKEIETYGIGAFNEKCKESVWKYVSEWADFTNRMGYWVDLKDPYVTYKSSYIESLWNIVKTVDHKGLLYKDYKVVPWCPRCGTGLSSHELAQGYQDVKDLAVTVKFKVQSSNSKKVDDNTYILAWTTTPWTLPGNVGLAVGKDIEYVKLRVTPAEAGVQKDGHGSKTNVVSKSSVDSAESVTLDSRLRGNDTSEYYIIAKERVSAFGNLFKGATTVGLMKGEDLVGITYEPLYPFLKENISGSEKEKMKNAYKVYAADFVTTTDGTGIVHTAVMYGQDDFELGTRVGLPKYHLVNDDGTFKKETGFLAGKFVKDEAVAIDIIKDLSHRGLLLDKSKYEHSYPFCWRCKTPLIYFARDSWYIKMSALRNELVRQNEAINWEPEHIKEGRFGEWLREIKDWAISRERYWGTPLPVWICDKCQEKKVVGSVAEISQKPKNEFLVMRHGEAGNNVEAVVNGKDRDLFNLTQAGEEHARQAAASLRGKSIDLIYVSPFARTRQTAAIVQKALKLKDEQVIIDERLHELNFGECEGMTVEEFGKAYPFQNRFEKMPSGGELYGAVKKRMGDFLYEIDAAYKGKTILVITHATPAMMLLSVAGGLDRVRSIELDTEAYIGNAEVRPVQFSILPHNNEYELDLHRPHIDAVKLTCGCSGSMSRVKEVMDVWFDSGAMPFAQDHYPFQVQSEKFKVQSFWKRMFGEKQILAYPADFISEAIDQTRGWFYTLHAIGTLMGKGRAFKNVICLGHILDGEGKKMSKSLGNIVDPWSMMDKYGADALRFWMYSVNQPGDSKNFEEKTVDEIVKKVFNLAGNVLSFYQMYATKDQVTSCELRVKSQNVLDRWIISRMDQVVSTVTTGLDSYKFFESTRSIRDFVADLSQWYLRRSRDRFKGDDVADKNTALATTKYILITLAKVLAPFTPFFAEHLYKESGGELESVHLENWPVVGVVDNALINEMELTRSIASMGLMNRTNAKINVRQPLNSFKIKDSGTKLKYWNELKEILKDEINVKNVELFAGNQDQPGYILDTTLTPALKEEGMVRELLRAIQDMRKAKGLSVSDKAVATIETDSVGQGFIEKNKATVMAACSLSEVKFGTVNAETVSLGDISIKVAL